LQHIAYYSITVPNIDFSSVSPLFLPDLGGSLIVSQYQNDFGLMVWGPFNKLTGVDEAAFTLGYYDISHFVRDFTDIMGISLDSYRKNVSGFYSESSKML
jgi:AraC-like DNA-binding protein